MPLLCFFRNFSVRSIAGARSSVRSTKGSPGRWNAKGTGRFNGKGTGRQVFQSGTFSELQEPKKVHFELSERLLQNITSFDQLRVFPTVRAAMINEIKHAYNLKSTYIKDKLALVIKPSPVQIAAIKKINQVRSHKPKASLPSAKEGEAMVLELLKENEANKLKVFTIAAETGSGKTWAYLAPLLSKLKEDDMELLAKSFKDYEKDKVTTYIRLVILLPTNELVDQVYATVSRASSMKYTEEDVGRKFYDDKKYAPFLEHPDNKLSLGFRVVKWGSGEPHTTLFAPVERGRVDVLVTTPSKLESLKQLRNYDRPYRYFTRVGHVVIDEADTLMDESWLSYTTGALRNMHGTKDLVFCLATIPKHFHRTKSKMFPDDHSVINIVTPSLHKIPRQISFKVIDANKAPYHGSKSRALAQALYAIHNDNTEPGYVKRVIVFVNEKNTVESLTELLVTKYHHKPEDIIGISGKDTAQERTNKVAPFLRAQPLEAGESKIKVLVTTDLLARGLNFEGIKNIILVDLPRNSVDLVHRVGRTGRMNRSGRVFVIIDSKHKSSWAKGLPTIVKKGLALG